MCTCISSKSEKAIAWGVCIAGFLLAGTPDPLIENRQNSIKSTPIPTAHKELRGSEALKQEHAGLIQKLQDLKQKKRRLEKMLSDQKVSPLETSGKSEKSTVTPYDTVTFTSGRKVKCSVVLFKDPQFKLEDRNGDSLYVLADTIFHISPRSEVEADIFPSHVVNKGPIKPRAQIPLPTPTPEKDFDVKDYMVHVRISRSRSKSEIDLREGYLDEIAENIQYNCKIESKALPSDAENLRLRIWVFAEGVTSEKPYKLVISEDKKFDLPRLGEFEFETGSVTLKYDEKGGGRYGFKLYGWLALLEDAKGNVVTVKGNRKLLEENLKRIKDFVLDEEVQL